MDGSCVLYDEAPVRGSGIGAVGVRTSDLVGRFRREPTENQAARCLFLRTLNPRNPSPPHAYERDIDMANPRTTILSLRTRVLGILQSLSTWLPALLLRLTIGLVFASTGWGKVHNI